MIARAFDSDVSLRDIVLVVVVALAFGVIAGLWSTRGAR